MFFLICKDLIQMLEVFFCHFFSSTLNIQFCHDFLYVQYIGWTSSIYFWKSKSKSKSFKTNLEFMVWYANLPALAIGSAMWVMHKLTKETWNFRTEVKRSLCPKVLEGFEGQRKMILIIIRLFVSKKISRTNLKQ